MPLSYPQQMERNDASLQNHHHHQRIQSPYIRKLIGKGQRVEVVVLASEENAPLVELQSLLAETQALPQIQTLTDEEIAAEIAAYR